MSAASFAKALALSHGSKPWVTKMITGGGIQHWRVSFLA